MGAVILLLMSVGFVLLVLPVVNFVRASRLAQDLAAMRRRVEELERRGLAPLRATERQPQSEPGPAPADASDMPREVSALAPLPVIAPPIAPPEPVVVASAAGPSETASASLEQRVGSRWLLYTGVVILLIGVSFFLKFAFDNEWIGPTGRVLMGAAAGVGLVAGGSRVAARGLSRFGLALTGTGYVILYLSIYAALDFYSLIGRPAAFAWFCVVTIAAVWHAHRTRDEALAFIAAAGGYVTPFLVGGDGNAQVALFTYDLLLGLGVLTLAARHRWLALPVASFVFTLLTIGA